MPNQHSLKGAVYVDEDLGNKTTFLVAYDVTIPTVRVTSPSGRVYSEIYPEYSLDHRLQLAKILIPGKAEVTLMYFLMFLFIRILYVFQIIILEGVGAGGGGEQIDKTDSLKLDVPRVFMALFYKFLCNPFRLFLCLFVCFVVVVLVMRNCGFIH